MPHSNLQGLSLPLLASLILPLLYAQHYDYLPLNKPFSHLAVEPWLRLTHPCAPLCSSHFGLSLDPFWTLFPRARSYSLLPALIP